MSRHYPLDYSWTLELLAGPPEVPAEVSGRRIPATVPGCVHTDLLAAGLIPEPYAGDTEAALAWIGRSDWRYRTRLELPVSPDAERVDLVCEGLDTFARLAVDGVPIGATENMHRSYRFDVTRHLTPGADRELTIDFAAPVDAAERRRAELGPLPNAYPAPFNFVRKMASNFGWDWGPAFTTSGIWRPVRLHAWSTARLASVRPQVSVLPGGDGRVLLDVDLERTGSSAAVAVRVEIAGRSTEVRVEAGATAARVELDVPAPELWWPRGHGAQPLYPLRVALDDADGRRLDTWTRRVGFREVSLDTTPDAHGTPFTIRVNGRPVQVLGANWITDDCFPALVTPERYRRRIEQAVGAGMNLLRVWGGGIYEDDAFYDVCDELGVLTWQDFLFACAAYPEDPGTWAEVEAEARDNVVRLMPHPSLVLWNGQNENIWGHVEWGWREELGDAAWGLGYYTGLLPDVVAELDPGRPYWPGSPYSGSPELHPNDPAHGNLHIWDVWNERDYTVYRDYRPRFVSEFGYQGPPTWSTLRRGLGDEPPRIDSPVLLAHQKAIDGNAKLARGLKEHFGVADHEVAVEDWHYLTQVNQARALTLGIEHFRSLGPLCTGVVVWQLNDCWPVVSWAAVDGDGRLKPLWFALRDAYAPRLLTVHPEGAGLAVVAANDTGRPWRVTATARRRRTDGTVLAERRLTLAVPPRSVSRQELPAELSAAGDPAAELLTVDAAPGAAAAPAVRRASWFWVPDHQLATPAAGFEARARRVDGGYEVSVRAATLLRDLCLFPDRLDPDAEVDDAMVTLLPGETHTFGVRSARDLDAGQLTSRPVLRSVQDVAQVLGGG